jgi:hypothetical protein
MQAGANDPKKAGRLRYFTRRSWNYLFWGIDAS